jgi:hypothetical protein
LIAFDFVEAFLALSMSLFYGVWAKPWIFFALVRELLSLAQRK